MELQSKFYPKTIIKKTLMGVIIKEGNEHCYLYLFCQRWEMGRKSSEQGDSSVIPTRRQTLP